MGRSRTNLELECTGITALNIAGQTISVVTLEREGVKNMFYAPSSLYWNLKNRPETNFIKYEKNEISEKGYEYPVFKFSK